MLRQIGTDGIDRFACWHHQDNGTGLADRGREVFREELTLKQSDNASIESGTVIGQWEASDDQWRPGFPEDNEWQGHPVD